MESRVQQSERNAGKHSRLRPSLERPFLSGDRVADVARTENTPLIAPTTIQLFDALVRSSLRSIEPAGYARDTENFDRTCDEFSPLEDGSEGTRRRIVDRVSRKTNGRSSREARIEQANDTRTVRGSSRGTFASLPRTGSPVSPTVTSDIVWYYYCEPVDTIGVLPTLL